MVNIVGLGYIGLSTALMMASVGVQVVGSDIDEKMVASLNSGVLTLKETGFDRLFQNALQKGIVFKTDYVRADIYIIAVPTPYEKSSKKIDLEHVIGALDSVLEVCQEGAVIVIESTLSPGTIEYSIKPRIREKGFEPGKDIHIAHAPERVLPGNLIYELVYNSRTIGVDSPHIGELLCELYGTFCKGEIIITNLSTAEMAKVVENTYRDINIAFANELAKICRQGGLDVYEIIRIANKHPRVGVLNPGPGVGGHCIAVDPWFLVGDYPGLANIILAARKINDSMPEFVLKRIRTIMDSHSISTGRVGLYGLTYKENVDDTRESPTLQLLECMRNHLSDGLKVYDPYVTADIAENQYHDFDMFLDSIDMVVIMVGHNEIIENMDRLSGKVILDTRNVCEKEVAYRL